MLGLKREGLTISTACTSSSIALGLAADIIRNNQTKQAIVVGAEELSEFVFAGFSSLRALSLNFCRPFDENRDGMILGEGAGTIILENEVYARKRKSRIYAELAGFGASQDAHHLTAPHPDGFGLISALKTALQNAKASE